MEEVLCRKSGSNGTTQEDKEADESRKSLPRICMICFWSWVRICDCIYWTCTMGVPPDIRNLKWIFGKLSVMVLVVKVDMLFWCSCDRRRTEFIWHESLLGCILNTGARVLILKRLTRTLKSATCVTHCESNCCNLLYWVEDRCSLRQKIKAFERGVDLTIYLLKVDSIICKDLCLWVNLSTYYSDGSSGRDHCDIYTIFGKWSTHYTQSACLFAHRLPHPQKYHFNWPFYSDSDYELNYR